MWTVVTDLELSAIKVNLNDVLVRNMNLSVDFIAPYLRRAEDRLSAPTPVVILAHRRSSNNFSSEKHATHISSPCTYEPGISRRVDGWMD